MGFDSIARRGLASALNAGCVLLAAGRVEAQTLPDPSVVLEPVGVTHSIARDGYRTNAQINHQDCLDDDVLTFPLLLTNRGTNVLEVWAGTECDALALRTTTTATQCWKLFSEVPATATLQVSIHVRSILAGRTSLTGAAQNTAPTGTLIQAGPEACIPPDTGVPVASAIRLYFMLIDPNTQAAALGTYVTWQATYKLVGPFPPDEISPAAADKSLDISFGYSSSQSSDTTINGYQFYCDPPPGAAPLAAPDAGAAAACAAIPPSAELVQGSTAVGPAYKCGTAPITATSGVASGLVNGAPYHVAMAAVDTYANIGPLSPVTCWVPQAEQENVSACSVSHRRAPARAALSVFGVTLAAWQLARRRARTRGAAACAPPR